MEGTLTVDERAMLLYAGCYFNESDPTTFFCMCTGYSPTKMKFEKNGRELMDSLVEKGLVRPYLNYPGVTEKEWGDYEQEEFNFDWTPEGREVVKGLFDVYWFMWCADCTSRFYPLFVECDGNMETFIGRLEAMYPNDQMGEGWPISCALDRLELRHDTAEKNFQKFIKCRHAPGSDKNKLLMDDTKIKDGRHVNKWYE